MSKNNINKLPNKFRIMKSASLSIETLNALFTLDREEGKLYWNERPREMFPTNRAFASWNAKYAGKEAGTNLNPLSHKSGWRQVKIFGKNYREHIIVMAIFDGKWPDDEIDHINGDTFDNRPCNLRVVDGLTNARNRGMHKNNTSGFTGVTKEGKKWLAYIMVNYKVIRLGLYMNKWEAIEARQAANVLYGFSPRHGT